MLDNCEHLLDVAAVFAEKLLVNCDHLTVLATSRERLGIAGERIVRLGPLSVAPSGSKDLQCEAETLFMDRARNADPGFSAEPAVIRELCARLDGMPLAIEIAATRSVSLGADGLLAGLEDHLRLLAGHRASAERHSSLRAVIDWSYDRLDADEQRLFRRLGIFAAGFDLPAATAVTAMNSLGEAADVVGKLTDKSLLVHRRDAVGSRWQMLGTIRSYALDRLAACGEEAMVRDTYLGWAAATAAGLDERLIGAGDWRPSSTSSPTTSGRLLQAQLDRTAGKRATISPITSAISRMRDGSSVSPASTTGPQRRWRTAWEAAGELHDAAQVALTEGNGAIAFDLMLASADRAAAAEDGSGRAVALAPQPPSRTASPGTSPTRSRMSCCVGWWRRLSRRTPANNPVAAAYLASADAWTANPEKTVVTESGRCGPHGRPPDSDPVLMSAALDGVVVSLDTSGRLPDAHQVCQGAAASSPVCPATTRAGAEIADTLYMVTEIAVTAGDLPAALAAARMAQDDDIASASRTCRPAKPSSRWSCRASSTRRSARRT